MDANDASSPGSLSSPPHSPEGTPTSTTRVSSSGVGVGTANTSTPTPANATSPAPRGLTASGQPRKKPGPKPKAKDPSVQEPEKKTRKPRRPAEPKDPNAAPARKRRTKASLEAGAQPAQPTPVVDEKPIIQNSPTPQPRPTEPVPAPQQPEPSPVITQPPRILSSQEPTLHNNPNLSHINVAPSTPRPSSSGQRYDPIRGGIMEDKPQAPASAPPPISPPLNRASASPSITSLIDPPSASNSFFPQPAKLQQQTSITSAPQSPASFHSRPGPVLPSQDFSAPQPQHQQPQQLTPQPLPPAAAPTGPAPMDIDSDASKPIIATAQKASSATNGTPVNSNAPTPPTKPARQKEAPPPLPSGSGLLSGTAFGPVTTSAKGVDGPSAPNIYLTFDLKGRQNTTINVALEIEKKYGFAALHPRVAARQERQRQIKNASAALERAAGLSADDMSVDLS